MSFRPGTSYPNGLNAGPSRWDTIPALALCGLTDWTNQSDVGIGTDTDAKKFLVPVLYGAGTTITGLRVKFAGETANDGVKIRLLKRKDDVATATAWTEACDQITTKALGTTVTETAIDEVTLLEGYSYAIEVVSVVSSSKSVDMFAIGIQTSIRHQ